MLKISKLIYSLDIKGEYKKYDSNIGIIIVPINGDFVYKIFEDEGLFQKELKIYQIFSQENINIPDCEVIKINGINILKLENIRKSHGRFKNIYDINPRQVAGILNKIHYIDSSKYFGVNAKQIILGDIHFSNFFQNKKGLGCFDFSSSKLGNIEEDLAGMYIEFDCNTEIFNNFIKYYNLDYDMNLIYKFTIIKLYEIIKHGVNLLPERIINYKKYILKIKTKYENPETKINIKIKTNGKSVFLQNKNINKSLVLNNGFGVIYKESLQLYFFEKTIEEDLSKIELINKYRHAKNYSLKITINQETNQIIGIGFGKILDSGLGGFKGIINGKIIDNKYSGLVNGKIINNHNDDILIEGTINCNVDKENLPKIFLDNYIMDKDKKVVCRIVDNMSGMEMSEDNYYSAYLFEPHEGYFQLTLGKNTGSKINLINYRYLEKDISIVFSQEEGKLIYFYTKINNTELFYFKEDLSGNQSKIDYSDNTSGYGNIKLDINIPINKLGFQLILNGELSTLRYPNY